MYKNNEVITKQNETSPPSPKCHTLKVKDSFRYSSHPNERKRFGRQQQQKKRVQNYVFLCTYLYVRLTSVPQYAATTKYKRQNTLLSRARTRSSSSSAEKQFRAMRGTLPHYTTTKPTQIIISTHHHYHGHWNIIIDELDRTFTHR